MVDYEDNSGDNESSAPPIRVVTRCRNNKGAAAAKHPRKHYGSPLFDDRCFLHPKDDCELMLPDVKNGRLNRKRL